jgi:hypothetical protein
MSFITFVIGLFVGWTLAGLISTKKPAIISSYVNFLKGVIGIK